MWTRVVHVQKQNTYDPPVGNSQIIYGLWTYKLCALHTCSSSTSSGQMSILLGLDFIAPTLLVQCCFCCTAYFALSTYFLSGIALSAVIHSTNVAEQLQAAILGDTLLV